MANNVFANGMEIASKSGDGKSICAFPDVCMTPPENPATPPGVPVPYPNTGLDSDTTDGTRSVYISNKEVMLKNKSYFKKSMGDEAGCAAKKGVVSSVHRGKVYFTAWSMDVKFEGENVVRNLDLTTHNHNPTPNSPPWTHVKSMSVGGHSCAKIVSKIHSYNKKDCKPPAESHHIIDNASFTMEGARPVALKNIEGGDVNGQKARNLFQPGDNCHPGENYREDDAPCICLRGKQAKPRTQHGKAHKRTMEDAANLATKDGKWTYKDARESGKNSIQDALDLEDWEAECIGLVLDAYYKDELGCTDKTQIRAPDQPCTATKFSNGKSGKNASMCSAYELVDA